MYSPQPTNEKNSVGFTLKESFQPVFKKHPHQHSISAVQSYVSSAECSSWVTKPFHADWRAFINADSWLMSARLTGDECKEKLGASYPAAPRCQHIKERSRAFWYRGEDSRTSFNPDSSPQRAFVDYCLVFPKWMPHRRQAADKLTEHTSRYRCTLAKQKSKTQNKKLCQMFARLLTQGQSTAETKKALLLILWWCDQLLGGLCLLKSSEYCIK